MNKEFLKAVEDRRTIYGISKDPVISEERVRELIGHALKHTPSAFNSQSQRAVMLLGAEHDKLWDLTKDALKEIVKPEQFAATEEKINSFRAGSGTVLYFDDSSIVKNLQEQFPLYAGNFPVWAQQANGMLQFAVWTSLESEGLGASLQHYNEVIEERVRNQWKLPQEWKLIAQMPFGKPVAPPAEKQFQPLESRLLVF